ncbi:MAG: CotH kinase family protein [Lachnospiraceae bacterium]|nr:CotH kinase family protein [Lachnospiraceae bacterium]
MKFKKKIMYIAVMCMALIIPVAFTACGDEGELPPAPVFSASSGAYAEGTTIALTDESFWGSIWYTTDGSDPRTSETAVKYKKKEPIEIKDRSKDPNVLSAIDPLLISPCLGKVKEGDDKVTGDVTVPKDSDVDKCTVVRAAFRKIGGTWSDEVSAVYFAGNMTMHIEGLTDSCLASDRDMIVISIQADYNDFFDYETGIYVAGKAFDDKLAQELLEDDDSISLPWADANYRGKGREWERTVRMDALSVSANGYVKELLSQDCGIRIQGNYSRAMLQKSFRLYAREEYGTKKFNYPFFGEEYKADSFKHLVLRSGCSEGFTEQAKFGDAMLQDMSAEASGLPTQQTRPCIVYLNGEYWGLYILTEDYTEKYFEDVCGLAKDDAVLYKSYGTGDCRLDEGEVPEGYDEMYYIDELNAFMDGFDDLSDKGDYETFCEVVDPENVMQYFALEVWLDNQDWPATNWSLWRSKTVTDDGYGDGRWRFVLQDLDRCALNPGENMIEKKELLNTDTDNPAVRIFALLMTNEEFKADYKQCLWDYSLDVFTEEYVDDYIDRYADEYEPLYDQFFARYPDLGSTEGALDEIDAFEDFMDDRPAYIWPIQDEL